MTSVIRLETHHDVPFPREAVWAVLSDTDWVFRSLGLPPGKYAFEPLLEGGSRVTARATFSGLVVRWHEPPFEWRAPDFYRARRIFSNGPLKEGSLGVELRESGAGETRIVVTCELVPCGLGGKLLAQSVVRVVVQRRIRRIIAQLAGFLGGDKKTLWPKSAVHPVAEKLFQAKMAELSAVGQPGDLVHRLEKFLRQSPDAELSLIQPLAVARVWKTDQWEVLRLFLHATKCGLLDLRWRVLCPNCRSSRPPPIASLSQVSRAGRCAVCQADFEVRFDGSLELRFAVNPLVRPHDDREFCLPGPGSRRHVVSQTLLEPGQRRAWRLPELTRPLRLRSPQVKQPVTLRPDDAPARLFQPVIVCEPGQFLVRYEYGAVRDYAVQVLNPNPFPVLLALEEMEWGSEVLTAARVTNWQEFRELFPGEVVSSSEPMPVGCQVVLFTGLRGCTALYQSMGDAPGHAVVQNHFKVLAEVVRAHHGAVVKTMGDALMAVFSRVEEGLAAVGQMHERLPEASPNPSLSARLWLKSSLHAGPCLAANANGSLDFVGAAVNVAARMVECCQGGDLTVSDEVYQQAAMAEFLARAGKATEARELRIGGLEAGRKVWRVSLAA
jgi:class 3 adenylate cyclase